MPGLEGFAGSLGFVPAGFWGLLVEGSAPGLEGFARSLGFVVEGFWGLLVEESAPGFEEEESAGFGASLGLGVEGVCVPSAPGLGVDGSLGLAAVGF